MTDERIFYLGVVKEVDATDELLDEIVKRYDLDVLNLGDEGELDYRLSDVGEELGYVLDEDLDCIDKSKVYAVAKGKLYQVVKETSINDFFGEGSLDFSVGKDDLGEGEKVYFMCPYDSGLSYMECLQDTLEKTYKD